jgi:hypothetical protein
MKPLIIMGLFIAACFPPCFPAPTNATNDVWTEPYVPDVYDGTLSLVAIRNSIQFLIDAQNGSKEDKAAAAKDGRRMISVLDTFINEQHK